MLPGYSSVSSSITPTMPYSPRLIGDMTSHATANLAQQYNPNYLLKQIFASNRGISAGPAQMQGIAGQIAQGRSAIANASSQIPGQLNYANQQSLLNGQVAQGQEATQLAGLGLQQQQNNYQYGGQRFQQGLSLLQILTGQNPLAMMGGGMGGGYGGYG